MDSYLQKVIRGEARLTPPETPRSMNQMVSLIFVLDISSSMSASCGRVTRLCAAQQAKLRLLARAIQQGLDVYLAVVAFNTTAHYTLPMTRFRDHPDRIKKAILEVSSGGGTNLSAPLNFILRKGLLSSRPNERIIMLSDGHGGDPRKAAARIKARGTIIETIGVADKPSEVAEDHLKTAASVQDGKILYRFIRDAESLVEYFQTEITNRLVKRR